MLFLENTKKNYNTGKITVENLLISEIIIVPNSHNQNDLTLAVSNYQTSSNDQDPIIQITKVLSLFQYSLVKVTIHKSIKSVKIDSHTYNGHQNYWNQSLPLSTRWLSTSCCLKSSFFSLTEVKIPSKCVFDLCLPKIQLKRSLAEPAVVWLLTKIGFVHPQSS